MASVAMFAVLLRAPPRSGTASPAPSPTQPRANSAATPAAATPRPTPSTSRAAPTARARPRPSYRAAPRPHRRRSRARSTAPRPRRPRPRRCATCSRGCARSRGTPATSPPLRPDNHRRGQGLPGQARDRGDRVRRPAHPQPADDMTTGPTTDELANRLPGTGPTPLDPRCLTGRAMCIDKSSRTIRWVIDGKVLDDGRALRLAVHPDPRGHLPRLLEVARPRVHALRHAMPFAMFFSGGQAVHYSSDFAARGYSGASHGCVNVRDHAGVEWLFDQVASATRSSSTGHEPRRRIRPVG